MDDRYSQLVSLLLSLFELDELERFVKYHFGASTSRVLKQKGSPTRLVDQLVTRLVRERRVDEDLFDKLNASHPNQEALIDRVRSEVLGQEQAPVSQDETAEHKPEPEAQDVELSPERAAWRRKLSALLDAEPAEPELPHGWIEAAAVLPHFDPTKIQPLGEQEQRGANDSLTSLAALCDTRLDGRWVLRLEPRQEAISGLWNTQRLGDALNANPQDDSPHRSVLEKILEQGWIYVDEIADYQTLCAVREVADWFGSTDLDPVDLDRLTVILDRFETIEPMRKLIGTHFRGRADELTLLTDHADGNHPARILGISGLGGVGKSTLLGKFLLDLKSDRPWVYLDFDNPNVDPTRPKRLVELIARHLGLFYTGSDDSSAFAGLESLSAGDRFSFTLNVGADAGTQELILALDRIIRETAGTEKPSLLLVLDTYEQVQVRGRSVSGSVETFVRMLLRTMPFVRVIISGRAELGIDEAEHMLLEDLDKESAEAVLSELGVKAPGLRLKIMEKFGTSPLNLRLAAEAISTGQLTEQDVESFKIEVLRLGLQGQLYTRILGHIEDGEVRRLAHPGLIVRRVTPDVIRQVLADVCDIDPAGADDLFRRLREHVTLFEPDATAPDEQDALRHRQDVRESMLELMVHDPAWRNRLTEIHSQAINHYKERPYPITRAEELYHRLMRDDEPAELDPLWSEDLAESLGRCWQEPLPDRARVWLGVRIGQIHGNVETWRTVDWEVSARREAKEYLEMGDAQAALATVRQRDERTPGSRLYWYEAEALRRLGRLEQALDVCNSGLASAAEAGKLDDSLKLHLLVAEIALMQGAQDVTAEHANRAAYIADELEDAAGHLAAQELLVRADVQLGDTEASKLNALELERSFTGAGDVALRAAPELSERILQTAGADSKQILRKAAIAFGNRSDQDIIKPDPFKLEGLLNLALANEEGRSRLSSLAAEVGLSEEKFDLVELAGQSIRNGRMGDAIATVLDSVGDDAQVREKTLSMFKRRR